MSWSSPVYFPHCAFIATALQCAYGETGPSVFSTTLENDLYLNLYLHFYATYDHQIKLFFQSFNLSLN